MMQKEEMSKYALSMGRIYIFYVWINLVWELE